MPLSPSRQEKAAMWRTGSGLCLAATLFCLLNAGEGVIDTASLARRETGDVEGVVIDFYDQLSQGVDDGTLLEDPEIRDPTLFLGGAILSAAGARLTWRKANKTSKGY
jgi:hypothetical protein